MKRVIFQFFAALFALIFFDGCKEESNDNSGSSLPKHLYQEYRTNSLNNLKQIGLGIMMFSSAHDDTAPESLAALKGYVGETVLIAKFDHLHRHTGNPDLESSYIYIGNIGKMSDLRSAAATPMAFESPALLPENHSELVVLYADGSTQVVKIPRVNKKSSREVTEILTRQLKDPEVKKRLLRNADLADAAK